MLDKATKREKLEPRSTPYSMRLAAGRFLLFRKTATSATWWALYRDDATGKRTKQSLGDFSHLTPGDRYTAAVNAANAFFKKVEGGVAVENLTVSDAGRRYVEHLRKTKGEASAEFARSRLAALVDSDPLGGVLLDKLRQHHVAAWRERVEAGTCTPPKRGPRCRNKQEQPPAKPRSKATVDRACTILRAALNLALEDRLIVDDHAWSRALRNIAVTTGQNAESAVDGEEEAAGRSELYLTVEDRRRLLDAIPCPHLKVFMRVMCMIPVRPGALALLRVKNFDARKGRLTIPRDKAGGGRTIQLSDALADLLREQARGKTPLAPLLGRADGKHWNSQLWQKPIKDAVGRAGLPPETVCYSVRHALLTDLSQKVDVLLLAKISGTSVAMLEKFYYKLRGESAKAALEAVAL